MRHNQSFGSDHHPIIWSSGCDRAGATQAKTLNMDRVNANWAQLGSRRYLSTWKRLKLSYKYGYRKSRLRRYKLGIYQPKEPFHTNSSRQWWMSSKILPIKNSFMSEHLGRRWSWIRRLIGKHSMRPQVGALKFEGQLITDDDKVASLILKHHFPPRKPVTPVKALRKCSPTIEDITFVIRSIRSHCAAGTCQILPGRV